MAWTDYRLTDPENGALISEWHFGEGSGTTVADEVASNDIDLTTPTDPNYTWETEGISLASGLIQTPSITGARTIAMLCRVAKDEASGFMLSGGSASGTGIFPPTSDTTSVVHTASGRGVVPIYSRASNGQAAYRINRGNWIVVFREMSTAYNTILGFGGRHSTTTSRCTEFEIAWAAVFDNVLTDAERQRIYYMARQLSASRSFYIDWRDCPSTAKLVGVWGQSNAEGRAKIANLSAGDQLKTTPTNVYISSRDTLTTAALTMGTNNQTDAPATDFGPEMGLAWEAEDASQTLYVSKYGIGSSYLANTGANDWSLDDEPTANKFNFALRNLWTMEADMLNAGVGPDLAGVLWMQGEQDATSATYGEEYGENLRPLVEKYREQMGDVSAKFCVARIREEDPTLDAAGVANVRKYQEIVGTMDANMSWIDTDAMTLKVDDVHYDAAGMKALGEATYAKLLAGEETPTYADASDVRFGVDRGDGTTGTCYVPTAAQVLSAVNVDATTGTVVLPSAASVLDSVSYGAASGTTGTYHAPEASEVVNTAVFGPVSGTSGTFEVPAESVVSIGVEYGAGGTEFTGTLTAGSGLSADEQATLANLKLMIDDSGDDPLFNATALGNVPSAEEISNRLERTDGPIDKVPKFDDTIQRDKTSASSSQMVETLTKVTE